MRRMQAGAETSEGCFSQYLRFTAGEVEAERMPIETLRRRRPGESARTGKVRERRQGEIPAKVFVEALERRNPGEHPAVGVLTTRSVARDSRKGQNPGTAACRAGPCSGAGIPTGETVCGFFGSETGRIPSGRRKLRRVNPKSAAGAKQNRHGTAGRKPSRG